MNNQEIYTKVRNHLLHQGRQAKEAGMCKYRTDEGLTCAVGCLIPESMYNPEIEDVSAGMVVWVGLRYRANNRGQAILKGIFDSLGIQKESAPLLRSLQGLHDQHPPSEWEIRLDNLAKDYNLEVES